MQMSIEALETKFAEVIDSREKINLLNQLAFEYQYEDVEKATAVAQQAQTLLEQMETAGQPCLKEKADTWQTLGFLHLRQHSDGLKTPLLIEALALYRDLKNTAGEARTLTFIGLTYLRMSRYERSAHLFQPEPGFK